MDLYLTKAKELFEYAANIDVSGFESPLKCLKDNLSQIEYPYDENFFTNNKERIENFNALSFQFVRAKDYSPWQELYLLDMLKVSIRDDELLPLSSGSWGSIPDISLWTQVILDIMKKYFHNETAEFLIYTISFIVNHENMPKSIKLAHLKLLVDVLRSENERYLIFNSSSFKIISMLFKQKKFEDCKDENIYRELLKAIQQINDVESIIKLKEAHYPINKQQRTAMTEYCCSKYKNVEKLNAIYELDAYFCDKDNSRYVENRFIKMASSKFDSFIQEATDISVSVLFYRYMVFLLEVYAQNQVVDKSWVHSEMIRIQQLWQNEFYEKQEKNLHVVSHEDTIPSLEADRINRLCIINPIIFAKQCIPCTEEKIFDIMQCTSEHILIHMVNRIILSPVYPNGRDQVNLKRHDIDFLLADQVKNLIKTKGYKLLNSVNEDTCLLEIHKRYRLGTHMMVTLFRKVQELYDIVQKETSIKLMPYSEEYSLGMLTQLFPVLELKVREFAALFGIFPFKKNLDEFMQYNDPSSLLREILQQIYDEQGSFENVPDLLFVYNIMYNSNSANVRNECIHGRDYLHGESLRFAMVVTLFAIYMIAFRVNTIKENVSDILELHE